MEPILFPFVLIISIVWIVFPFVVMSRLKKTQEATEDAKKVLRNIDRNIAVIANDGRVKLTIDRERAHAASAGLPPVL